MMRRPALTVPVVLVALAPAAHAASLEGAVHERGGTRVPPGARVTVVELERQAPVDARGRFAMDGLKPGLWTVRIEAPGYLPVVTRAPLEDARPVVLKVGLRPGTLRAPVARVTADRPSRLAQTETSRRSFSAEELRQVAGARNDPILAVTNTAGVHTGSFMGAPSVRGGAPGDNRYYLDSIQIGNPFHFGGLVSVFNGNTISKVDLYTGALPARFGNVLSAVIDVETRPPRQDGLHGSLDANLLYSEGLLEGPLAPGVGFALSGRRSYLDLLVAKFFPAFTVFPVFDDYQARLTAALPGGGRLDLATFGSQDAVSVVLGTGTFGRGVGEASTVSGYTSTGAVWRQPLQEGVSNRLVVNYQEPTQDTKVGTFLDIASHHYWTTFADDYAHQLSDAHELRAGVRYDTINYLERRSQPKLPRGTRPESLTPEEVDTFPKQTTEANGNQKVYGGYLEDAWKIADPLTLAAGVRYDRLGSSAEEHFAPRAGLTWRMDPDTTWRVAYGQQFQFPTVENLLPVLGNPNLEAGFARDYVLGVDRQVTDTLLAKLELYHRDLFRLISRDPAQNLTNLGSGRSDGIELTLEASDLQGWSGVLALTLSSAFRTPAGSSERPYDYDQPLLLNLTAMAPKLWDWTPSLRFRYSSGRPYTRVVGRTQRPDGTWAPVNGVSNGDRYPDGITWSARAERPAGLGGLDGRFYFEITQQHEVFTVDYGTGYANYANPTFNYGIPAIPYLGYQLRF